MTNIKIRKSKSGGIKPANVNQLNKIIIFLGENPCSIKQEIVRGTGLTNQFKSAFHWLFQKGIIVEVAIRLSKNGLNSKTYILNPYFKK